MKLEDIVDLRPQIAEVESGAEPSIRMLIEKYYKPHFPEMYKQMTDEYLEKLGCMLEVKDTSPIKEGDLVRVLFDSQQDTPESFTHDGVNVGDIGMVSDIDRSDFPINVQFNTGAVVGFTAEELEKV